LVYDEREISYDPCINDQKSNSWPRHPAHNLEEFEGNIHPARKKTEPFSPVPLMPEAICFDEANHCIEESRERQYPKLPVGHVIGEIEKYPGIAAGRIQMEVLDKPLGSEVKVLMNVFQQIESGEQYEQAFGRFKDGYDTKTALYMLMFHICSQRASPVRKGLSPRRYDAFSPTLLKSI
jgi:hypothetical protein